MFQRFSLLGLRSGPSKYLNNYPLTPRNNTFVFGKRPISFHKTKGLHNILTNDAKKYASIFHGAAIIETPLLQNFYQYGNQEHATIKLIYELMHLQENQFHPTKRPGNIASSLNHNIIAHIIGATLSGEIRNPKYIENFINEWRQAHEKQYGQKPTKAKIKKLINLFTEALDENHLYPDLFPVHILLSILYYKTDNKQEILDFLTKIHNQYAQILDSKTMDNFDTLVNLEFLPADTKTDDKYTFEQSMYALYNPNDYTFNGPEMHLKQSAYKFKDNPASADCMETSVRALFNALLIDLSTGKFDLALLPKSITPKPELIHFVTTMQNHLRTINTPSVGQEWMNMVSGHNFLLYAEKNLYDLEPCMANVRKLMNHFFNINAQNFTELGELLSDERRTITFRLEIPDELYGGNRLTLSINRRDLKTTGTIQLQTIGNEISYDHALIIDNKNTQKDDLEKEKLLKRITVINPETVAMLFLICAKSNCTPFDTQLFPYTPQNLDSALLLSSNQSTRLKAITNTLKKIEQNPDLGPVIISMMKEYADNDENAREIGRMINDIIDTSFYDQFRIFLREHPRTAKYALQTVNITEKNSTKITDLVDYLINSKTIDDYELLGKIIAKTKSYLTNDKHYELLTLYPTAAQGALTILGNKNDISQERVQKITEFLMDLNYSSTNAKNHYYQFLGEVIAKTEHYLHNKKYQNFLINNSDAALSALHSLVKDPGIREVFCREVPPLAVSDFDTSPVEEPLSEKEILRQKKEEAIMAKAYEWKKAVDNHIETNPSDSLQYARKMARIMPRLQLPNTHILHAIVAPAPNTCIAPYSQQEQHVIIYHGSLRKNHNPLRLNQDPYTAYPVFNGSRLVQNIDQYIAEKLNAPIIGYSPTNFLSNALDNFRRFNAAKKLLDLNADPKMGLLHALERNDIEMFNFVWPYYLKHYEQTAKNIFDIFHMTRSIEMATYFFQVHVPEEIKNNETIMYQWLEKYTHSPYWTHYSGFDVLLKYGNIHQEKRKQLIKQLHYIVLNNHSRLYGPIFIRALEEHDPTIKLTEEELNKIIEELNRQRDEE